MLLEMWKMVCALRREWCECVVLCFCRMVWPAPADRSGPGTNKPPQFFSRKMAGCLPGQRQAPIRRKHIGQEPRDAPASGANQQASRAICAPEPGKSPLTVRMVGPAVRRVDKSPLPKTARKSSATTKTVHLAEHSEMGAAFRCVHGKSVGMEWLAVAAVPG